MTARIRAGRRTSASVAWASVASVTTLAMAPGAATAFELDFGKVTGSLDTTVSIGIQTRTQGVDADLVGIRNRSFGATNAYGQPVAKGDAYSVNNDDGTLNYDQGIVSTLAKFTTELDLSDTDNVLGAFIRADGYYNPTNDRQTSTDHRPLSDAARAQVGSNLRLLDAYGELNASSIGLDLSLRGGRQVISWGESTFIPGGINVVNPVDVSQLRTPGAELRNALLPQGMVSFNASATDNVSLEGFYQFEWKEVRIDRPGTFFSTNDFVGKGQDRVMLGFGSFSEFGTNVRALYDGAVAPGTFGAINVGLAAAGLPLLVADDSNWLAVTRSDNRKAKDDGQFGLAMRLFAPALNDTEFGLYFVNYHSRLPVISAETADATTTSTAAAQVASASGTLGAIGVPGASIGSLSLPVGVNTLAQGAPGSRAAHYFIEYPEDIQLFGASFNTQVGTSGLALQGEYSFKNDVPLQVDDAELLFAALSPLDTALGGLTPFGDNQLSGQIGRNYRPGEVINGYIERDVSQFQFTATKVLGPTMRADTGVVLAETGFQWVHGLPSKSTLRMNGPGTNTSGNPRQAGPNGAHAGKAAESEEHFADDFSWGYRIAARLDYNNVLGRFNLSPRIQWQHDVNGVSPGPGGPFLAGRKAISIGVSGTYLQSWEADLSWTGFFGAGRYNLINDRDFFSAALKYSF